MKKLVRITTVPSSLRTLLCGQSKFMSQYFEVIGVSSSGDPLQEVEQNEGIRTKAIKMTRTISPIQDLHSTFKLYKFFKKEKPFIVHTHTPKAGTVGMLAARLAGVPHRIHTIAGMPLLEATGLRRKLLNAVERFTYSCATMVLPNSNGLREVSIKERFAKPSKLLVIGHGSSNGIDVDHYHRDQINDETRSEILESLDIKSTDHVFIFIGRMVKDKGINELVAAFNSLNTHYENCKLILVGPREEQLDPLDKSTNELIETHANIHYVGIQKDIRPYVIAADVLVHPSYREGFPNVVLQGSCMGLPCIVSDINGCNEIISQGFNGLIVPPKSVNELEKAMSYIIENPELKKQMGSNARPNIVKKYRQEFIWDELLKVYKTL